MVVMVGAAAFRLVILPRCALPEPGAAAFRERAETLSATAGLGAALALVPLVGLTLLVQALEFRDPFDPMGPQVRLLLTATLWGRVWQVQSALVVGAVVAYAACRSTRNPLSWLAAGLVTLGVAATPALSGHSMAAERLLPVAIAADALHVVAAGTWLGGLGTLVVAFVMRPPDSGAAGRVLTALVVGFSPVALAAASLLALSGFFAAWLHLGELGLLWTSGYGRILLAKLAVVGAVAMVGAYNWKRMTPRLTDPGGVQRFVTGPARWELALGIMVLLITAVLVAAPLPFDG